MSVWVQVMKPDVLCLQETKISDEQFPYTDLADLGYEAVHRGDGRWNGVAILSRVGIDDVVKDGLALDLGEAAPDLAVDLKERVLGSLHQDQLFGVEGRDDACEFAADRTTRARDEDALAGDGFGDAVSIEAIGRAADEFGNVDVGSARAQGGGGG